MWPPWCSASLRHAGHPAGCRWARPASGPGWSRNGCFRSACSRLRRRAALAWTSGVPVLGGLAPCALPGRLALPAKLPQPLVRDAEVVPDLVDDGPPDLLDHLGLGIADGADRLLVKGDAGRQLSRVAGRAARQRHALVEAEQSA